MVSSSKVIKKPKEQLERIDGKRDLIAGELSIWQLVYLWFRSLTLIQGSFNYAYFQGSGYVHTLFPWFRKIYAGNKTKLKEALISNIEFYNTGPALGHNVIAALHIYMLQSGVSNEEVKGIKFSLMGPLAGINDSLFNFGSQPLFAGIAAALSANGSWSGFWFFMIVYNAFQFTVGIVTTILTYKSGQKFVKDISSVMAGVVKISSMVGITIIGALAITYTSINLSITNTTVIISEGTLATKITSYQAVLNKFVPYILPVLLIGFTYFMMAKKNWSMYKALIFILLMGISGYVYGVF